MSDDSAGDDHGEPKAKAKKPTATKHANDADPRLMDFHHEAMKLAQEGGSKVHRDRNKRGVEQFVVWYKRDGHHGLCRWPTSYEFGKAA